MAGTTVAVAVGTALAELGVDQVFGLAGSGNFAITNALIAAGARYVPVRHEGNAVVMADAFARVTGRVPACSVHQGPGLTNTITGLAEAAKARTPMLVLAGESGAPLSNFRIDQAGLAIAVGAIAERLHTPASALADATRAVHRARAERRPVLLNLPLEVQSEPAPEGIELQLEPVLRPPAPAGDSVREAAALLASARRPLLIAGRGSVLAAARKPLEQLAERLGALLATSAAGHGLFSGNPWSLGISGGFASPLAARLIAEADVVAAFGATLNMWTTRHGHLLGRSARVVQADLDPEVIGAHRPVDVALVGDAATAARALLAELEVVGAGPSGWRTFELAEDIAHGSWREAPYEDAGGGGWIDPRTLSRRLDEILPPERTLAIDSGHFMGWPAMYMRVPDERGFVFTQAFQAVGLGLASAIGAAVARPERLTVAAVGDGGLLMAASELETVARLGLRMLVVVYNDAAYGAEVHHFGPHGDRLDIVRFPDTDIAALARGAGLEAVTVRKAGDLAAVEHWVAAGMASPLLVDAKVVPDVVAEWLEEAFRGH